VLVTTLTKRMSEDLTDYLQQVGVRVRYMHSDIDAIERMEIVRGLRLGEFDVLVGHQPAARGARHARGVARRDPRRRPGGLPALRPVAHPDRRARGAQRRRAGDLLRRPDHRLDAALPRRDGAPRTVQVAHNEAHGITPRGVQKSVDNVRFVTRVADAREERDETRRRRRTGRGRGRGRDGRKGRSQAGEGAEQAPAYDTSDPQKLIAQLEAEMKEAAKALDFEQARGCATSCSRSRRGRRWGAGGGAPRAAGWPRCARSAEVARAGRLPHDGAYHPPAPARRARRAAAWPSRTRS
jgi:excinuclease ABC subunit B